MSWSWIIIYSLFLVFSTYCYFWSFSNSLFMQILSRSRIVIYLMFNSCFFWHFVWRRRWQFSFKIYIIRSCTWNLYGLLINIGSFLISHFVWRTFNFLFLYSICSWPWHLIFANLSCIWPSWKNRMFGTLFPKELVSQILSWSWILLL